MFHQTQRQNVSRMNQSVEAHLEEAQDFLTDALDIAEDMRNLTAVRTDILLLHSATVQVTWYSRYSAVILMMHKVYLFYFCRT